LVIVTRSPTEGLAIAMEHAGGRVLPTRRKYSCSASASVGKLAQRQRDRRLDLGVGIACQAEAARWCADVGEAAEPLKAGKMEPWS